MNKTNCNSIAYAVRHDLCTGCGICEDVCKVQAIKIRRVGGENRPQLDQQLCLKCGKCLKVCPGVGCDLNRLAKKYFSELSAKNDCYIGSHCATYTGYSLNHDIRYHSASGGLVSQFLIYLLEKGHIDGAVVTRFSNQDKLSPESFIARSREEIISAKSSKYCPVSMNLVGNEIANREGRYIIVGLPCHIQGFRKRSEIDKNFRDHVIGYFSIYCSSNRTFDAQDFLMQRYLVNKESVTYFSYRDNGCLGNMVIEQSSDTSTEKNKPKISVPFAQYYGALRSFFKPRRCLTCIDHYGELADASFGDIHIDPYLKDVVGISSLIVRNPYFDDLFRKAVTDGYIEIHSVDAHTLNESQKAMLYPKQRRAHAQMRIDRLLGREIVVYDKKMAYPRLKDYFSEIVIGCQRLVGRHHLLWFIVSYFFIKAQFKKQGGDL